MISKPVMAGVSGAELPESALVQRCLEGTRSAWDEFAREYYTEVARSVRHTLVRLCRRAPVEDVENVAQEVFSGLLEGSGRRLRTFSGQCSLIGWLRAVAMRRAINYIRDEKRRRGRPLDEHLLFVPEARAKEGDETTTELIRALDSSLEQLGSRDRLILKLHYLDGMPLKSIAELLGVSRNTIWPMVTRARRRLQQRMRGP